MTDSRTNRTRLDAIAPPHIRAEAAVWVAELHSPDRTPALEDRLRRWLAADPQHAAAFELATDAWQDSGNLLALLLQRQPSARQPLTPTRRTLAGIAGIAALAIALTATVYYLTDHALTTGPAEQRTVELSDGTQVSLNANTRLQVDYNTQLRKVILTQGEALFNVAKHHPQPFVVIIGDRKIIALGTAFEVRREDPAATAFTVTLMEGKVAIEPLTGPNALPAPLATAPLLTAPLATAPTVLKPGDRLHIAPRTTDTLDHPSLDQITAWRRGELIFEDASLRDAAAEFNRYGKQQLTIDDTVPLTLRVGGVFQIGDPESFAQAMANTYRLTILERGGQIILTR